MFITVKKMYPPPEDKHNNSALLECPPKPPQSRWPEIELPKKQHNNTKQSNKTKQNAGRIKTTKWPQAEGRREELFSLRLIGQRLAHCCRCCRRATATTKTTTKTTMAFVVFVRLRGDFESRKSSFCLSP